MTGIHPTITRAEYDAITDRVNWSRLRNIGRSARHYQHRLAVPRRDTPSLSMGRAVHVAVLEPDKFALLYTVWPGERRQGAKWEEFRAHAAQYGREILTADEYARCIAIKNAVHGDEHARKYVTGGRSEVTALWSVSEPAVSAVEGYDFNCKGRIDYVRGDCLVDLKTTRDASQDGFGREAWKYRYHTQAAFYADGYEAATGTALPFVIVAVESEAPHVVQVYRVPDAIIDLGREEYRAMLGHLALCQREDVWPGYSEGELDLVLPRWAVSESDEDDAADLDLVIG